MLTVLLPSSICILLFKVHTKKSLYLYVIKADPGGQVSLKRMGKTIKKSQSTINVWGKLFKITKYNKHMGKTI